MCEALFCFQICPVFFITKEKKDSEVRERRTEPGKVDDNGQYAALST